MQELRFRDAVHRIDVLWSTNPLIVSRRHLSVLALNEERSETGLEGQPDIRLDDLCTGSFAMHHLPIRSIALDATHVLSASTESGVGQKRRQAKSAATSASLPLTDNICGQPLFATTAHE
jgi:hypothetical protein